jgi:hypothetical protein
MRIPIVKGVIDRRLLVNYRVAPEVLQPMLPPPFRPKLQGEYAVAGICLICLRNVRPRWLPGFMGVSSENAAHRIAVEWDSVDGIREGVYIPRRDTSSKLNAWAGGRFFPGEHQHARFVCREEHERFDLDVRSDDGKTHIALHAETTDALSPQSAFPSVGEASRFFERGSLGYSATRDPGRFDGLELQCLNWHVQPLGVSRIQSSYFDDATRFPVGTAVFDCALLMRNVHHEWHGRDTMCCRSTESALTPPAHAARGEARSA